MQVREGQLRGWQRDSDDEGFTLIELLIVTIVLGILAAIVVFAVQNLGSATAQTACASDFKTVENAVESYKAEMGNYPDGTPTVGTGIQTDTDPSATTNAAGAASGTGSELLTASDVSPNDEAQLISPAGPWLTSVPQNGTRYYIWVANNGSGAITVGTGIGSPTGTAPTATTCAAAGVS
jgi:prepilin-type N-terminal cleavage/methylation domain-containing protein